MSRHVHKLPEHNHTIPSKGPREVTLASEQTLQPLAPSAILQRAVLAPESLRPAEVVRMQQTLGNRAVGELLNRSSSPRPLIQAKLIVTAPGDEYEQEADRMAEEVMRMPVVQREDLEDEDEEPEIMTKREPTHAASGAFEADEEFEQQLRATRGQGQPLPPSLREEFETKFGADFSGVRVHVDALANQLNQSIQAKAFTHAQDIYLGAGQYSPDSIAGKRLLAHELTHVVQQNANTFHPLSIIEPTKLIPSSNRFTIRLQRRRDVAMNLLSECEDNTSLNPLVKRTQKLTLSMPIVGDISNRIMCSQDPTVTNPAAFPEGIFPKALGVTRPGKDYL